MFRKNIFSLSISFLLMLGLIVAGCDDSSTGSEPATGTMEVELHDAPADYEAVNVNIERVMVNNAETDTGWVEINSPQQTYDLLKLTNGATAPLGSKQLPAGRYDQIRLIVSENGNSVTIDGTEYDLFVPSGAQTGVKLNIDAEIEEDITYTLLLDFDAARSVVKRGNNQSGAEYLLQPVISASSQAESGNIAGSVSPSDAEPFIYAISNTDTLSSTKADTSDGTFKLIGLEEGNYDISVDPTNENYQPADTSGISVSVGETNDLGTIELQQN